MLDYWKAELEFIAGLRNPRTGVALVGDWGGGLALVPDTLGSRIWGVSKLMLAYWWAGLGLSWSQNRVWPAVCGLRLQGARLWFLLLVGEAGMDASRGFLGEVGCKMRSKMRIEVNPAKRGDKGRFRQKEAAACSKA